MMLFPKGGLEPITNGKEKGQTPVSRLPAGQLCDPMLQSSLQKAEARLWLKGDFFSFSSGSLTSLLVFPKTIP